MKCHRVSWMFLDHKTLIDLSHGCHLWILWDEGPLPTQVPALRMHCPLGTKRSEEGCGRGLAAEREIAMGLCLIMWVKKSKQCYPGGLVNIKEVVNDSVNGCKWIIPPSACIEAYWSMKGWSILAGITFVKMLKKVLLSWPAAQRTEMDRVKRSMQGFQERVSIPHLAERIWASPESVRNAARRLAPRWTARCPAGRPTRARSWKLAAHLRRQKHPKAGEEEHWPSGWVVWVQPKQEK